VRPFIFGRLINAALALALMTAGGQASGQAPPVPAGNLERAEAMVETGAFEPAATMLRQLLSVDPANRRAQEMLAFALESLGDLEGERQVRSDLATQYPGEARIQSDYGRVLERSGDDAGALRAYRRARELSGAAPAPELDAAIERMRGRTAMEVGTPRLAVMSDPAATASCAEAGAAIPIGSRHHVAFLGTHYDAEGRASSGATTTSDALALTFVLRHGARALWSAGPRVHVVSPAGGRPRDLGVGGAIAGRTPIGPSLEAEWKADFETPWDESAVTVLHGGRSTAAEAHLYSNWFNRRLLLQVAARRRRLSVLAEGPNATRRPRAWESLRAAGADVVLWRRPRAALRGEMLDEALMAGSTLSSAMTLAYRHYDVATSTTPEFSNVIGLAPRGSVDEASVASTLAAPGGGLGLELRAGLARDSARQARDWRIGGALIWAPNPTTRLTLGFEDATEIVTGLVGQRREGRLSFHVDL
jgi:tetratricopeptide (TPR) repeat protein